MAGASWEAMLATVQYFGLRGTLVVPSTVSQLKKWTDAGIPVVIAWNPENRPWSHASCVFDVDDQHNVHVMDANIPNPSKTVRVVPEDEFYSKWSEAIGDKLIVRRPAMAIEREVTPAGRQVMATQPLLTRRDYGAAVNLLDARELNVLKTAQDLPADVERYVEEGKDQGLDEDAAWAVAWSRYCKYKNPGSEHCQMNPSEYFKKAKFPRGESMTIDEVAKVVGPEFKEMNENPPPSVVKVMEGMQGKTAGRTTHLDNPDKPGFTLCGERADPKTTAKSVKDTTCHYCEVAWQKAHGGLRGAGRAPLLAMDQFADMLKDSKYEEGKPADPTENMSPEDAKEWKRQTEEHKDEFKTAGDKEACDDMADDEEDALVTQFFGSKTAASGAPGTSGGKYGFTKATEDACGVGVNKLSKTATKIAKALYAKDESSPSFLSKHAGKGGSKAAAMLLKAMEGIGPMAQLNGKTAGKSGNGLYGFGERTAKLGLEACTDLKHEAGVIASDLFARKGADPIKVAGYLTAHAKKAKCAFSDMLGMCAPDLDMDVSATVKKASDFLASGTDAEDAELADIISKC